jgi:hypothetical protein
MDPCKHEVIDQNNERVYDNSLCKTFSFNSRSVTLCRHVNLRMNTIHVFSWGRRGHDRMVVAFITMYAISAYHH